MSARLEADRNLILIAAYKAQVAAEALMRAALSDLPVEDETLEKLADAAKLLVEVELDRDHPDNSDATAFYEASVRFLDGWAG